MPDPATLRHGCTAPTGITLTGTLIHKVTTRSTVVNLEGFSEVGVFSEGHLVRSRVDIDVSGECLSTLALQAKGTGSCTALLPYIDDVQVEDNHEGISTFALKAHYYE